MTTEFEATVVNRAELCGHWQVNKDLISKSMECDQPAVDLRLKQRHSRLKQSLNFQRTCNVGKERPRAKFQTISK